VCYRHFYPYLSGRNLAPHMRLYKETIITGFAIFSLFFGAGNLIFPPFLGYEAGGEWPWATLGFAISAVIIPILGIAAHARLQGTLMDFGKRVHPVFSLVFGILIYAISISIPAPRTASVTYEMAFEPYFDWGSFTFSAMYFGLVLLFALNRSKLLDLLGRYLTPTLLFMLVAIIGVAVFGNENLSTPSAYQTPLTQGLTQGYQTFDAIAAIVVGAVVIISLNLKHPKDYARKKKLISYGGLMAGTGLFIIYMGLIYIGHLYGNQEFTTHTELLSYISYDTLGSGGRLMLSFLMGLACLTTATGIVTGTADFVKELFKGSQNAYVITVIAGCILGVLIGQMDVSLIIAIAVPVLFFIYPITITLILLNLLPKSLYTPLVFRAVVITVFVCSIPDFLGSLNIKGAQSFLPLGEFGFGWVLPAILVFAVTSGIQVYVINKK
tara:strand:- start:23731 stop:25047 length:1317 start_codon:yes stop_codon:yes gene_type:complete